MPEAGSSRQALSVLIVSTLAFTICFMVWMMFGVIGIPIRKALNLSATQFGLLTATPVLAGSLIRVPLGIWTDRLGGRIVMAALLATMTPVLWLTTYATQYWHFLALGLLVGVSGGAFSVGMPYVARWFPRRRQGLAMGIYGAGNSGAAINKFVAPAVMQAFGWAIVPKICAAMMACMLIVFWMFSKQEQAHVAPAKVTFAQQLLALKDPRVLRYCQYYSFVFGGYVALSLWLVLYYVDEYGLDLGMAALLAACFSLPGGLLRILGGWLADKYGAHKVTARVMCLSWLCLLLLSCPQVDLVVSTVNGTRSFHLSLSVYEFTALMTALGVGLALGKASVFKYVSDEYPQNIGAISGVVGLSGGIGGFLLPILFGALVDLTGVRASVFMLLFGTVCVSLTWMYFAEVRRNLGLASVRQEDSAHGQVTHVPVDSARVDCLEIDALLAPRLQTAHGAAVIGTEDVKPASNTV